MNASAFFAAESATRERRLGPIDAHLMSVDVVPVQKPKLASCCRHCGRKMTRRGLLCDVCLKRGDLTTERACCVCGTALKKRRYFADTTPLYCSAKECQRERDRQRKPRYTAKGVLV